MIKKWVTANPIFRRKLDWFITSFALIAWFSAFHSRQKLISLSCVEKPLFCHPENLNPVDKWGLINDYHWLSDHLSFWTQDGAGLFAVLCILRFSRDRQAMWTHLLLFLQATFINGALNESIRLIVQRPRPFVYLNPIGQGGAVDHYTSFYSGHTSFAALASTCALIVAMDTRPTLRWSVATLGIFLTVSTGAFRVIAGRHFVTDVLIGALAGAIIALWVNRLHRDAQYEEAV
ncbi:MAG: phosphatase PAP2 family protein [Bdellovibrionales bacterium]|nr:phosphatase PAP2 family protein [Bdellovibrionales bacterium]